MTAATQRTPGAFLVVKGLGFEHGGFAKLSIAGYEFPAQQIAREHFAHDELVASLRAMVGLAQVAVMEASWTVHGKAEATRALESARAALAKVTP